MRHADVRKSPTRDDDVEAKEKRLCMTTSNLRPPSSTAAPCIALLWEKRRQRTHREAVSRVRTAAAEQHAASTGGRTHHVPQPSGVERSRFWLQQRAARPHSASSVISGARPRIVACCRALTCDTHAVRAGHVGCPTRTTRTTHAPHARNGSRHAPRGRTPPRPTQRAAAGAPPSEHAFVIGLRLTKQQALKLKHAGVAPAEPGRQPPQGETAQAHTECD